MDKSRRDTNTNTDAYMCSLMFSMVKEAMSKQYKARPNKMCRFCFHGAGPDEWIPEGKI